MYLVPIVQAKADTTELIKKKDIQKVKEIERILVSGGTTTVLKKISFTLNMRN